MKTNSVPKIRFKGFTDDWEQRKLGEMLVNLEAGVSVNSSDYDTGYFILKTSAIKMGNIDLLEVKSIVSEEVARAKTPLIKNSIIISRMNTPELVGASGLVRESIDNIFLPDRLWQGQVAGNFSPEWLIQSINIAANIKKIRDLATGTSGSMKNISKKSMLDLIINVPTLEEQQKIGSFFKQLDETITLHQRKCEQTKELKKFMLQKMFPKKGEKNPEIRFPGFTDDWEQRKLGDLLKEFSIKSTIENEYKVLSSTNSGMEFREGRVSGTSNLGYKIVKNGDLVLSPQNLWLGNININNLGKGLVSPSYKTFELINIDSSFINPQLRTQKMLEEYKNSSTQGASVVRRNLEIDSFYQIKIFVPTISEQEKIGSFFKQLDNTIALHQRKCEQLKELKKFMLQNMFPKKG